MVAPYIPITDLQMNGTMEDVILRYVQDTREIPRRLIISNTAYSQLGYPIRYYSTCGSVAIESASYISSGNCVVVENIVYDIFMRLTRV